MVKAGNFFLSFVALFLLVGACSNAGNQTPAFIPGSNITTENAAKVTSFDATDITSVVDYYFASRIRGDDKWMEVMPPKAAWTDRLKQKLSSHNKWNFTGYQLQEIDDQTSGQVSADVRMDLEYQGETDSGVDNIILEKLDGKWIIVEVPT